jgi:DNA-binding CsgD family transcriptional regulator
MRSQLAEARRKDIHRRIGEALETDPDRAAFAGSRAAHWEAADEPARAIRAYIEFGLRASNGVATDLAAASFARAARLRESLAERDGLGDVPSASALLASAADQYAVSGQLRSAASAAERAQTLALNANDLESWLKAGFVKVFVAYRSGGERDVERILEMLVRRLDGEPHMFGARAFLLSELGFTRALFGRASVGLGELQEAQRLGRDEGDEALAAEAGVKLAYALLTLERYRECADQLAAAVTLMLGFTSLTEFSARSPWSSHTFTAINAIEIEAHLGNYATALEILAWARRPPTEDGRSVLVGLGGQQGVSARTHLDIMDAYVNERIGNWSRALAVVRHVTGTVEPVSQVWLSALRAKVLAGSGHFEAAHRALDVARQTVANVAEPTARLYVDEAAADVALSERRIDRLRAVVEAALQALDQMPNRNVLGLALEAARLRGEWAELSSKHASARSQVTSAAHLRRAVAAAETTLAGLEGSDLSAPASAQRDQCRAELERLNGVLDPGQWSAVAAAWHALGRRYEEAYCLFQLADTYVRTGRSDDAAQPLVTAHELCIHIGAMPMAHAIELAALPLGLRLERPGAPRRATRRLPTAVLTRRENDVLRLVAQGASNRDVASKLLISDRTAAIHVSNILRKLDVRSRGQAVAAARRGGLLDVEP